MDWKPAHEAPNMTEVLFGHWTKIPGDTRRSWEQTLGFRHGVNFSAMEDHSAFMRRGPPTHYHEIAEPPPEYPTPTPEA